MEAILSRVGVSDVELRQHCVAAVQNELQQANKSVQDVVAALEQALKVVKASRELHKSLVLNASDQIQVSFRQLGTSCNQIGPLLRLLHHKMGATTSATVVTTASTTSAVRTVSKPSMDSSSSTASEYEPSSNEGEDDEPEVVEVTPSKNSKKRKPATLDLSESPPLVRRKTTETLNTKTARNQLAGKLKEIRAIPTAGYTVMMHKELASFVKKVFAADKLNNWEPRDDVKLAQLLNEMKKRMGVFKDSVAQTLRWKAIEEWQKEMTGASFVPTLDLTSTPPKMDPRVAFTNVSSCQTYNELKVFAKPLVRISSEMGADASNTNEMRQKYFQPLLGATNKYLAAVTATKDQTIQNKGITQCIRSLKMICLLADGANITQKECVQLEEMLYLIRLIMHKNGNFRKIIMTVTIDLLTLFPPSSRPDFNYPTKKKKKKTKHKST